MSLGWTDGVRLEGFPSGRVRELVLAALAESEVPYSDSKGVEAAPDQTIATRIGLPASLT